VPVVACGVTNDARAAVNAIHAGAKEYIPLPPDPDLIAAVLAAVADDSRDMIYRDESMAKVVKLAKQIAASEASVLITGESGTGKKVLARFVHSRSTRAKKPFISVNCAAIPENLLESELFGHEKGAFTGALQRRLGRFESAQAGTIFLDEIGELPMETQIALLRVLQEREIERLGSHRPIPVDVRVLTATNRNLQLAVDAGTFRQDLFYRLNVFPIEMPSLRQRPDDIPLLVQYYVERYAKQAGKRIRNISKRTLELCQTYDWPGNVRELQNVIERAVVLCDDDTFSVNETWLRHDASAGPRRNSPVRGVGRLSADQEKQMIEAALMESDGRISGPSGAATKLGIPRQTLESKISGLGINKYRFKSS
jgi:DNA-binding NtrC family response regulator